MHLHRIQNTHICSTDTDTEQHTTCTQFAHTQTNNIMHREQKYTYMQHTIRTQNAHRTHTQTYMQHNYTTQDIAQDNAQDSTENITQPQRTEPSAHNYRTYSLAYYQEFAYINNSNTIELYTISKE